MTFDIKSIYHNSIKSYYSFKLCFFVRISFSNLWRIKKVTVRGKFLKFCINVSNRYVLEVKNVRSADGPYIFDLVAKNRLRSELSYNLSQLSFEAQSQK